MILAKPSVYKNLNIIKAHKDAFHKYLRVAPFFYYMVVPTFSYQLHFPKSPTFRYKYFAHKVLQFIALCLISSLIFLEYTFPMLTQSKEMFDKKNLSFFKIYPYVS